ncbi:hypothetical protein [Streptomyces sp. LN785]
MPLAATHEVADDAAGRTVGVGAFNVIPWEHAQAIVTGAEAAGRR